MGLLLNFTAVGAAAGSATCAPEFLASGAASACAGCLTSSDTRSFSRLIKIYFAFVCKQLYPCCSNVSIST